jgi:hypothetical protein
VEQLRFGRFYGASFCCDKRYAVTPFKKIAHMSSYTYGTASPSAGWRTTLVTDKSYLASGGDSHWLIVPGVALCRAVRDLMHHFHQGCGWALSRTDRLICDMIPLPQHGREPTTPIDLCGH